MPLNGKTPSPIKNFCQKKSNLIARKYRECVKHSDCAIRKISSIEVMGQINFNKYVARGREDGGKCRLKETPNDIRSNV